MFAALLLMPPTLETKQRDPEVLRVSAHKIAGDAAGGAVLGLGASGSFDASLVTCPTVLYDGKRFLMWYSSLYDSHMGRGGIGMASSQDGIHWKRENNGRPVLTIGAAGAFDDGQVMGPMVLLQNGVYRMWYTGMSKVWHSSGFGFYRIGLATSKDGVHWKRANHAHPVLNVGPMGAKDEVQVATPSILVESGHYRMWYAAWAPLSGHTILTATSHDGVHWTREADGQPVSGLLPGGQYSPAVIRVGTHYLMLYMRAGARKNNGLFAAVSLDGRHWKSSNADSLIQQGDPPAFDSFLAGHPCLLNIGDRLMAWYTGYRKEDGGPYGWKLRIGAAELQVLN